MSAEHQRHFVEFIDVSDVFQDYLNLLEFLVFSWHLRSHTDIMQHNKVVLHNV